jgi:hypothetical protein
MKRLFLIGSFLFLIGCWHPVGAIHLEKLNAGMGKPEVLKALGQPFNVRGCKKYEYGTVEVWEYRKYMFMDQRQLDEMYFLYFLNGQLEEWGAPGDWQKEADTVYEMRIR